jgi:hypothetical protein
MSLPCWVGCEFVGYDVHFGISNSLVVSSANSTGAGKFVASGFIRTTGAFLKAVAGRVVQTTDFLCPLPQWRW